VVCPGWPGLGRGGSSVPVATCRTSVEDLERAAALGWRATETARVGEWLLRAAGGFTGRANSALALGDPGVPVAEAVARVAPWYAERGLRPLFLLPTPSRYAPALDGELDRRGWTHGDEVRVLVAPVAPAAAVSDRTVTAGG